MLIDLLPNLHGDWQRELGSQAKVCAQRDGKVLGRVVRVVYVPLKLVAQKHRAYANVELDGAHKLAFHLAVLAELVNLFFHLGNYFTLETRRQVGLFDHDASEGLHVPVGLCLVPKEGVLHLTTFQLNVQLHGYELQVWLTTGPGRKGTVQMVFLQLQQGLVDVNT